MIRRFPTTSAGHGRRIAATVIACAIVPVSALAACSSDDGDTAEPAAAGDTASASGGAATDDADADSTPDAGPGDGVIGAGTLTITLEDGTAFEFIGDCEILVESSSTRYFFTFEGPDGQLASAGHAAGDDFGNPTSLQFTDDDLWIYRGTSYTDTATDGTDWSSDVVIEALVDNEPFMANGRVDSVCS